MFSQLLVVASILLHVLALDPPDTSNDPFPPYPPLENSSDPTIANYIGTRLYGWKGCLQPDRDKIVEAYGDMNHIVSYRGTSGTIDWTSRAAEEYFGPSWGSPVLDDDTRAEIQSKYYNTHTCSRKYL